MKEEMKLYFKSFGESNKISGDVQFKGAKSISIGNNIEICNSSNIIVHEYCHNDKVDWNIKINDNVLVNIGCIIQAFNQIEIGKYVMLAPYVYISDNNHEYSDYNIPIRFQMYKNEMNKVLIKEGSWIGTGVRIIGNVTVGYGAVVGANAVVVKDVPDHCVVGGNPAQIIKICDYRTGEWVTVKSKPYLIDEILTNRGIFKGYDSDYVNTQSLEKDEINAQKQHLQDEKIELMAVIKEGVNYIDTNLDIEAFDEILKVLIIVIDGMTKIETIINKDEQLNNNIINKLNTELSKVISLYEINDVETTKKIIEESIIPIIREWNRQIIS